jgi:hypothetical protein
MNKMVTYFIFLFIYTLATLTLKIEMLIVANIPTDVFINALFKTNAIIQIFTYNNRNLTKIQKQNILLNYEVN